jgi:hypothetical protein
VGLKRSCGGDLVSGLIMCLEIGLTTRGFGVGMHRGCSLHDIVFPGYLN